MFKLAILSLFLLSGISHAKCPQLKMGWEVYKPFQYEEAGKLTGLDVEILNAVYKLMSCKYGQIKTPWKRLLLQIEEGKLDIAAGATPNDKRAKYANFSHPYSSEAVYFYTRKSLKNKITFSKESDLIKKDRVLGVVSGAYYGPVYEKLLSNKIFVKNKNIIEVSTEKQLINMIINKRIDGALIGGKLMNFHKDVHGYDKKLFIHHTTFMFSKKTVPSSFIKDFDKHLKILIKNKTVAKIKNKFLKRKDEEYKL